MCNFSSPCEYVCAESAALAVEVDVCIIGVYVSPKENIIEGIIS